MPDIGEEEEDAEKANEGGGSRSLKQTVILKSLRLLDQNKATTKSVMILTKRVNSRRKERKHR